MRHANCLCQHNLNLWIGRRDREPDVGIPAPTQRNDGIDTTA
ncbi:hypothetical protein [Azospirillum argentinense]